MLQVFARLLALSLLLTPVLAHCEAPLSQGEHIVVLNGVRLWYRVAGQLHPGQAPLIYLAGGPGYNTYSFEKSIGEQLERHTQMIYFDERGTGHSERPWTNAYAMPTLVQDIEALRQSFGIPKISLMGHSFGGAVAAEYASHYPEHVRQLVIVDGALNLPQIFALWSTEIQQRYPEAWKEASSSELGASLRVAQAKQENCEIAKRRFALDTSILGKVDSGAFHNWQQFHDQRYQKEQEALDGKSGLRNTGELSKAYFSPGADFICYRFAAFKKVTMPTLVIVGKYDGAVGVDQMRSFASSLPNAQLDEFEASAHFPYAEEPTKFEQDLAAFLSKP